MIGSITVGRPPHTYKEVLQRYSVEYLPNLNYKGARCRISLAGDSVPPGTQRYPGSLGIRPNRDRGATLEVELRGSRVSDAND